MENASKALIMAGGVLVAIMLISFMVLFFRSAGSINAEYDIQVAEREVEKFNSQFEAYAKEKNSFFDVITVANLAYDVNKKNDWDAKNGVLIKIKKSNGTVIYSILNDKNLQKNYFFENEGPNQVYMYDKTEVIDKYTEQIVDTMTGKMIYKYNFKCVGENSILYNTTTVKSEKCNL